MKKIRTIASLTMLHVRKTRYHEFTTSFITLLKSKEVSSNSFFFTSLYQIKHSNFHTGAAKSCSLSLRIYLKKFDQNVLQKVLRFYLVVKCRRSLILLLKSTTLPQELVSIDRQRFCRDGSMYDGFTEIKKCHLIPGTSTEKCYTTTNTLWTCARCVYFPAALAKVGCTFSGKLQSII